MTKLRATDATLSSTYSWARWPAANTIDGNLNTICASKWQAGAWLSIALPAGSAIDYVAVYNRADVERYAGWLNPFEVWVGNTAGDLATKCAGPVSDPWTPGVVTPFVVACPAAVGSYVTLKQTGQARYLTVLEMEAYTSARQSSASVSAFSTRSAAAKRVADAEAKAAQTHPVPIGPESDYFVDAAAIYEPNNAPADRAMDMQPATIALAAALVVALAVAAGLLVFAIHLRRRLSRAVAATAPVKVMVELQPAPPPAEEFSAA